ncbi:hypothetical protein D1012_00215 [Pseudotabrizicola alkalilacus]|uniref:Methyl-accepting transducer domain-containing protein n=1 Tax=Pseudotabrizicola alkalilacus TaxID=2305252 RepID=A0A411Z697_9RHOB|nr:hypothetical protein D1012_00215 [Pseudotabrizicola alkalilacus]
MPETSGNSLSEAGIACRDSFAELAVQLADVQNAVLALLDLFSALAEHIAAQGEGSDPVDEADRAARTLLTALPATSGEAYGRALSATRAALQEIAQEARSLKAYASLTRLTAASLRVDVLEAYVAEVQQIAETVHANAQSLNECVEVINKERAPAMESQRAAQTGLHDMLEDLGPARAASADLAAEDRAFRTDLGRRVDRLARGGRTEISALISMVQFADQFAQRLEHIETILGSDVDRNATAPLAGALESALVADAEAICSAAVGALNRLGNLARRSALVEGDALATSPLGRLLQARREALECVQRCNHATAASLSTAAAAARQISEAIAGAQRQFDALRASAASVSIAATNALLLPGRTGEARMPLSVLAKAVQESSAAFRDKTAAASLSIGGLSDSFDAAVIIALEEGLAGFDASVQLSSVRIGAADESQRKIGSLLSEIGLALTELDRAARDSRTAMGDVLRRLRTLRKNAAPRPVEPSDPQPLEQFIAIYTMAREREVHAALTGIALTEPEPAADEIEFF